MRTRMLFEGDLTSCRSDNAASANSARSRRASSTFARCSAVSMAESAATAARRTAMPDASRRGPLIKSGLIVVALVTSERESVNQITQDQRAHMSTTITRFATKCMQAHAVIIRLL